MDTQDPSSQPPTPRESLDLITVPDGFHVSLFAGEPDVAQPIAIEYDDRGRLWVLESFSYIEWKRTGKDRLLIFEDTDNDGVFDKRTVFWDQGNHTSGFQIGFGGVWLCDAPELLFIPDADRDDVPDGPPTVVLDGWTTEAEHNFFNGLAWGPDGWLYGRHGIKKPSKVGRPGTPEAERIDLSCCIWRYHPVKKTFELVAEGTVNPWGLDWNEEGEGFLHTSVIDHLWHLVPGALYPRMSGLSPHHPYAYDLMEPTSDHRHWTGGETGRRDFDGNDDAGGGHSHSGMVIYQADAFPEEYRGRAFFSNVLGQRINTDHLVRSGSAWVAKHGEDFLKSSSPWFRAVDLKQGPHGEIMIAEWTDLGECHDRDGIHRSSGRLYEVWHGDRPDGRPFDLATLERAELFALLRHGNVWWRRRALRNLHERIAGGEAFSAAEIGELLNTAESAPVRDAITAIQALHLSGLSWKEWLPAVYEGAKGDARAPLRVHALTLTFTEKEPSGELIAWLGKALEEETAPSVQYRIAALLQRIPVAERRAAAEKIARIRIPEEDTNFRLMRWYGFEPLVAEDPVRALRIALEPGHPYLSQAIARRAVAAGALSPVLQALSVPDSDPGAMAAVLGGLLEALPGSADIPEGWIALAPVLKQHPDKAIQRLGFRLAHRFGDPVAEQEMVDRVMDRSAAPEERKEYFGLLVSSRSERLAESIPALSRDPELALEAIRAEAVFPSAGSTERLLTALTGGGELSAPHRSAILETLASRADFADALVAAVLDGKLAKGEIPTYIARQVAMVSSQKQRFTEYFGLDAEGEAQKAKLLQTWKKRLSEEYLAHADPVEGRAVYARVCAACHQLYGEGGNIGPDLTGSGRADLDYFLINVLFPSEDVAPEYRLVTLTLKDGRTLSGNIASENDEVITFRQVGQIERIDVSQVADRQVSEISLMPPGLLDPLRREDVRDLVAYLRTKEPPAAK